MKTMLKSKFQLVILLLCAGPTIATSAASEHPTDKYVHSIGLLPTDASVNGVQPFVLPPPRDLSAISAEHWAGVVSQTKEAMAKIYGRMSPEETVQFEAEWAPYFAFPSPEVLAYFEQLHPLVAEFVMLQKACTQTAVACDSAQFELVVALDGDDNEAAVSLSYNLKQLRGVLDAQAARIQQLAAAVVGLGPLPDVEGLRQKAAQRHQQAVEIIVTPLAPPGSLEGVWSGKGLGRWTIQVLRELQTDVLLLDINQERCVLERQPLANVWVCVMGWPDDAPDEATLWRLELIGGRLIVRSYEPSRRGDWYEVGRFKTVVCQKTTALTRRINYNDEWDADFDGKPINWLTYYHDRIQAQPIVVEVLRNGGLPQAKERSRRREWAAANAKRELNDAIELTALEQGISRYDVDREKAQGRAFERKMAEQYYYYGDRPPGFDNGDYTNGLSRLIDPNRPVKATSDHDARLRRQHILLWGLYQRLQRDIKQEYDYVTSLCGFTPEQIENDLKVLREANAELKQMFGEQAEIEKEIGATNLRYGQEEIGKILYAEQVELDHIAERELEDRHKNTQNLKHSYQVMTELRSTRPLPTQEIEAQREHIATLRKTKAVGIPSLTRYRADALREKTRKRIAAAEAFTAKTTVEETVRFARAEKEANLNERIAEANLKRNAILLRSVRRAREDGGSDFIPFEKVLEEARYKVEVAFNLPGYIKGLTERMDAELPVTVGSGGIANFGDPEAIPADCRIELPARLASVRGSGKPLDLSPDSVAPTTVKTDAAEKARLAAEQAKAAKQEKIELFEEEIRRLRQSLEGVSRTGAEIAANDRDRDRKLAGLARDRLSLEANIHAAEDQIRFVETGVYTRTRTAADDYNRLMMAEDSRATANYWENVFRKINRMNRLIEQAPPDNQLDLRRQWNGSLESAIAAGCKFDQLDQAARELGNQVADARIREGLAADAEAARAERNMAIAEGVKTVCDYSLTFATMYATAGVAAPASLILPTCAESAVSASYQVATGYIQGGPAEAFKQGAGAYSQVAGLFGTAIDAYQQGVLDHLDAHAHDPQRVTLDEGRAGRSAMAWVMGTEGVKQAAMALVVTPNLLLLKEGLNAPTGGTRRIPTSTSGNRVTRDSGDPPPSGGRGAGGGIFGPEEMRFKSVAQIRDERLFRNRDIYGKHLMYQFRKASTDLENARGAGKSSRELAPFIGQVEQAYKAANSDFHAKIWMKRMVRQDESLLRNWCDVDTTYRAKLAAETRAELADQNYSVPAMGYFSNSASTGSVGMDIDYGFIEPCRWMRVPHWKDPSKTMTVVNPDYLQWRRSLRGPALTADGGPARSVTPRQYARAGREAMNRAYERVYGHPPDEAFTEFTFRDSPEAFKDLAWLGRERQPNDKTARECWADFAKIDAAWTGQAADVTGFKVNRLEKPGATGAHDEFSTLPRYSTMLEQYRGLVKDLDTKFFGAKANTEVFGNESGNAITINPAAPLARAPVRVQHHFRALRSVLLDFASGRITPTEAERRLHVLTGGKGVLEIPKEMRIIINRYNPKSGT